MISYIIMLLLLMAVSVGFAFAAPRNPTPIIQLHPPVPNLNNEDCIEMVRIVENWDGYSTGRNTEEGPYQIKRSTWRQYSKLPHWLCLDRRDPELQRVMLLIARDIRREMKRQGLPDSPYYFALIYNAGARTVLEARTTPDQRYYAERAQNIFDVLLR